MLNLSLNKQKLIAKIRGMKGYERKSENDLIQILSNESKTKMSLSKKNWRHQKDNFNKSRYKFSKSKINEIRKTLYDINNQ